MKHKISKEAGNVLFLILIAVALFAALSYAVTSSTRSGGGNTKSESDDLMASQMVQHMTAIEQAIQRMRLINGCSDTQINFSNPADGTNYDNPLAPADGRCNIFSPNGGGVSRISFNLPPTSVSGSYMSPAFVGVNDIPLIGKSGCGVDCVDLLTFMWVKSKTLCEKLNVAEGNKEWSSLPSATAFIYGPYPFKGTYAVMETAATSGYEGKRGACYAYSVLPSAGHIYYHVILPR